MKTNTVFDLRIHCSSYKLCDNNEITLLYKWCLIITFLLHGSACLAQNTLTGYCKTADGENLLFATLLITEDSLEKNILSYTQTDDTGAFSLKYSTLRDSVYVTIRHVSYKSKQLKIATSQTNLLVIFNQEDNQLDPIEIKAQKSLTVKGDTLRYNTDALIKKSDYSVEDVLARIPGIEIKNNGAILYNGKAISHFYINGLDLLEGKYAVASRGIPANAVDNLEILRKHNHERVKSGEESDKVAVNINIKDETVFFGTAKSQAGLPLLRYDLALTPILIKDKTQLISSLYSNNAGIALSANTADFSILDSNILKISLTETNILQKPNTSGLQIASKYWLDNVSHAVTADYLTKLQAEHVFKVKVYFSNEENKISRSLLQDFTADGNNLRIFNNSQNNNTNQKLGLALINEVNKPSLYFKNKFNLMVDRDEGVSLNVLNNNLIRYNFNARNLKLTNRLDYILKLGSKTLSNILLVELQNQREFSNTSPGVFQDILTQRSDITTQHLNIQEFNVGSFTNLNFNTGGISWTLSQGLRFANQQLESSLNELALDSFNFPFINDYNLNQLESQSTLEGKYRFKKFVLSMRPVLSLEHIDWKEPFNDIAAGNRTFAFFQPSGSINYNYNSNWSSTLFSHSSTTRSSFENLYAGLVLTNYDALSSNPKGINIFRNQSVGINTRYKNEIKGMFANLTLNKGFTRSDFTNQSVLGANGLSQLSYVDRENRTTSLRFNADATKTFTNGFSINVSYEFRQIQLPLLFNGLEQRTEIQNQKYNLEMQWDNNTWFGIKYKTQLAPTKSFIGSNELVNRIFSNNLSLNWYSSAKTRVNIGAESLYIASNNGDENFNNLFDAAFYYQPNKKALFSVEFTNILNQNKFFSVTNTANSITTSTFNLRPRQLLLGLRYSL